MKEKSIRVHDLLFSLAESSSDLIAVINSDFFIEFFNESYRKYIITHFGKEVVAGSHLPSLLLHFPDESRQWMEGWNEALKGKLTTQVSEIQLEGTEGHHHEISYIPIHNSLKQVTGALQIIKDTTDRKRLENQAEIYKNFYTLANSLPQIIWTATPDGLLDYFNDQWYVYSGMDYKSSVGIGWTNTIHKDDLPQLITVWNECLVTGDKYHIQARVKTVDNEYRWLLIRALPYKNAHGKIVHWVGTCTDIEDQKESELKLHTISQELIKANEDIHLRNLRLTRINSDLDNFVYTASHDLKAPINNIESLVNSLYENIESSQNKDESKMLLKLIDQSVERFKNTINDLTEVAKVQNDEGEDQEDIMFAGVLKEVQQTLNGLITKYGALITSDFSEAPLIRFSMKNMRSIFYNLLSNAIKYSKPNQIPRIHIYTQNQDNALLLSVQDNGLGIKEKDKDKVFKIFKRLHLHVEGSGIGMSIVKRIMDNQGGKIEIQSQVNEGTVFRLYFTKERSV